MPDPILPFDDRFKFPRVLYQHDGVPPRRLKSGADTRNLDGASMARRDFRPTFFAISVALLRLFCLPFAPLRLLREIFVLVRSFCPVRRLAQPEQHLPGFRH